MERVTFQHDIWPDTGSNVTRVFQVINTDGTGIFPQLPVSLVLFSKSFPSRHTIKRSILLLDNATSSSLRDSETYARHLTLPDRDRTPYPTQICLPSVFSAPACEHPSEVLNLTVTMKGLINLHTLDVIYSLPTFDGKESKHVHCPASLTWNEKMNKHFVAGLIRAKLNACQKLRPLTLEIKSTVQLIQLLLGEAEATDYLDALVHLAVNNLCLPQIIKRLAPVEASSTITFSRATLLTNGLVAALFLKRHSHVEALLQLCAQAHSQTHSFGEPLYVAALYADPRTFCDLIDATMATRQQTTRQLLESRLFVALERAASAGRALIFNHDLHESLGRICHHYPRRVYYESALKGAMLASCAEVGEALLNLLRIEGDGRLLSDNKSFWIEILRLSCSGNSRDIAQQVLDDTGIQGWSGSLDLPLEDASRLGNFELVTLLMSRHSKLRARSLVLLIASGQKL